MSTHPGLDDEARLAFCRAAAPEGILSTLSALASTLLGVLAGEALLSAESVRHRAALLVSNGCFTVAAGYLWSLVLPIHKPIWTGSYALFAGGLGLVVFGLFHAVGDREEGSGPESIEGAEPPSSLSAAPSAPLPSQSPARPEPDLAPSRVRATKNGISLHSRSSASQDGRGPSTPPPIRPLRTVGVVVSARFSPALTRQSPREVLGTVGVVVEPNQEPNPDWPERGGGSGISPHSRSSASQDGRGPSTPPPIRPLRTVGVVESARFSPALTRQSPRGVLGAVDPLLLRPLEDFGRNALAVFVARAMAERKIFLKV